MIKLLVDVLLCTSFLALLAALKALHDLLSLSLCFALMSCCAANFMIICGSLPVAYVDSRPASSFLLKLLFVFYLL